MKIIAFCMSMLFIVESVNAANSNIDTVQINEKIDQFKSLQDSSWQTRLKYVQELYHESKAGQYCSGAIQAQLYIGQLYRQAGKLDSSYQAYHVGQLEARGCENDYYIGLIAALTAANYKREGRFGDAVSSYKKGIEAFARIENSKYLTQSYLGIGHCFKHTLNYDSTFYYYSRANDICDLYSDSLSKSKVLRSMASVLLDQKDTTAKEQIYDLLTKAKSWAIRNNNSSDLDKVFGEFGNYYSQIERFDSAVVYERKVLRRVEQSNNRVMLGFLQNNIAITLEHLGNQDSALYYVNRAIYNAENTNQLDLLKSALNNKSRFFEHEERIAEAIAVLVKSVNIEPENLEIDADGFKSLSQLYSNEGKYRKANEALKQWNVLSEQLAAIKNQKAIEELKVQYDVE